MTSDFSSVTELPDELVSSAQLRRLVQRYYWAGELCRGKDVLEVACGVGQGLGYLASVCRSVHGGDITPTLVQQAVAWYQDRFPISVMDAERLPFASNSLDAVILFEAIYYLASADRFAAECRRVLRPGGTVLLATANRDLFDFNPSPFSVRYYGIPEMRDLFAIHGFESRFYGGSPVSSERVKDRLLRLAKKAAVSASLIPSSMRGKRWLKRLVFGKLIPMPRELTTGLSYEPPIPLRPDLRNTVYQVLYCAATLR